MAKEARAPKRKVSIERIESFYAVERNGEIEDRTALTGRHAGSPVLHFETPIPLPSSWAGYFSTEFGDARTEAAIVDPARWERIQEMRHYNRK
jgi:hypothetical protein